VSVSKSYSLTSSDCGAIPPCAGQSWYGIPALSAERMSEGAGVAVSGVSVAVEEAPDLRRVATGYLIALVNGVVSRRLLGGVTA
jgi:hypothetical protein